MRTAPLLVAATLGLGALGCATSSPFEASSDAGSAEQVAAQAEERIVIDVRTEEEFAAGHLAGADLIDVQQPDFEARVDELPRDAAYFIYCRTGNRSAQAIERMRALGFTDLVNGGAFGDLAEAGLETSVS